MRHWATGGGERLRAVGISGAQWRSSVALTEMEASGEGDSPPLARIVGDCTAAESAASDTDPHIGRGPPEAAFLPHVWRGSTPAASLFCCRGGHCNSTRTQQPDPTRLLSSTGCDATQRQSCRRRYSTLRESIRLWAEERGRKRSSVGATRPHVNTEMSALWGTALHGLADQPRGLGIGKQSPGTQIRNLRVEPTDLCRRRSLFMRSV